MGTHYRGTDEEIRALDAYIKLMRASDSLSARLSASLAESGLTMAQFGVLEALLHLGPMCQKALGRKLLRSGGNMTTVLDNLERAGTIRRVRDTHDRRYVTVHLTASGRTLIENVFPSHASGVTRSFSALSAAEQEQLGRLLRKLGLAQSESSLLG